MITKKAEYAIIALTELARQPDETRITSRTIARRRRIPLNLITQLLGVMREAGWIASTRGPAGGIRLLCDPSKITLREVIELFDGPIKITRCLLRDKPCHDQASCPLRGVWSKAQDKMLEVLAGVTIQDLAAASAGE